MIGRNIILYLFICKDYLLNIYIYEDLVSLLLGEISVERNAAPSPEKL